MSTIAESRPLRERHFGGKSRPSPAVVRIVTPLPAEPSRDEVLKARMLYHLADTPRLGRYSFLSSDRWSWAALHQIIGGRVRAAHFRRLIDELIAEGKVVEVWEAKVDGWSWRHQHVLVLAERFHHIAWYRLVQVVGREDVLERLGIEEGHQAADVREDRCVLEAPSND